MSCGIGGGERGGGRSSAFVSLLLRLTVERTSALGMHYARLRTRCTLTDDQMVTEVTPASSSCGGAFSVSAESTTTGRERRRGKGEMA